MPKIKCCICGKVHEYTAKKVDTLKGWVSTKTEDYCVECWRKKDICKTCGFDKNIPREPVFVNNKSYCFAKHIASECSECGHQSDGSTILKERMKFEPARFNKKHTSKQVKKDCSIERRDLWDGPHIENHLKHKEKEEIRKKHKSRDKHSRIVLENEEG